MTQQAALVVDRAGLARKLAHRPKSFVLYELVQNAWDENVKNVFASAEWMPKGICCIKVMDDSPEGFTDLASVYTLFRDSKKGTDPEKRGRFELGEKLIAALAQRMEVATTKGTIIIEGDKRFKSRRKLECGTLVTVYLRMTRPEFGELCEGAGRLIPPRGIVTTFNGKRLVEREPAAKFETTLPTVRTIEGVLVAAQRKTKVLAYQPLPGETPMLYEMGIPVVELPNDRWHFDVQQRVPVNFERNNVPPTYLRTLRVEALNALHHHLDPHDAATPWVADALEDKRAQPEAVDRVIRQRFGDKAVIYDPSDTEGTKLAVSKGYTVVHGGTFSQGAWHHIKQHQLLLPAGQVTPGPKVYDPDGEPEKLIPRSAWTADMGCRAEFAVALFAKLQGWSADFKGTGALYVDIVDEPEVSWLANFGRRGFSQRLCLNFGRLGPDWFALPHRSVEVLDLLLHEFGHARASDHLSSEYHRALTHFGAALTGLALDEPEFFR